MPPWPPGTAARTSAPPAWPWPLRTPQPSDPLPAEDSAASPAAQGADEGIDDDQGEDRGPDGGRGGRRLRSGGRLRLVGRGGGQYRVGVVCVQEAAPLQREQQRERWPYDYRSGGEQDDDRGQGTIRGARVAEGHVGARQQYRI